MTTTDLTSPFTPNQELFLETLIARVRLGENVWTFTARHKATATVLASRGIIGWKNGIVENSILAWFTPAGEKEFITKSSYKAPTIKKLKKENKRLRASLKVLLEQLDKK